MAGLQKEKEVCLRHGNETANANIEGGSVHLPFSLDEERGVVKKIDWFVLPMVSDIGPFCRRSLTDCLI